MLGKRIKKIFKSNADLQEVYRWIENVRKDKTKPYFTEEMDRVNATIMLSSTYKRLLNKMLSSKKFGANSAMRRLYWKNKIVSFLIDALVIIGPVALIAPLTHSIYITVKASILSIVSYFLCTKEAKKCTSLWDELEAYKDQIDFYLSEDFVSLEETFEGQMKQYIPEEKYKNFETVKVESLDPKAIAIETLVKTESIKDDVIIATAKKHLLYIRDHSSVNYTKEALQLKSLLNRYMEALRAKKLSGQEFATDSYIVELNDIEQNIYAPRKIYRKV